jgi:hypothetical protein
MLHPGTSIKPRWDLTRVDMGFKERPRGWYDAQCQGAVNDYCRYVGTPPSIWWSCALAGSSNQYTDPGTFFEKTTSAQPCKISGNAGKAVGDRFLT